MQAPRSPSFPVVSMGKFTLLYFVTMGFYAFYWFYQCWLAQQSTTERQIFPLLRTLFSVFFVHSLFKYIQSMESKDNPYPWNASKTAWLFIEVGAIGSCVMIASDYFQLGPVLRLFVFVVLLFAQFYILYRVQLVLNRIANDPFGSSNSKMSLQNKLWVAFGVYLWFGTFYNCYLEATGQVKPTPIFETQTDNPDTPRKGFQ